MTPKEKALELYRNNFKITESRFESKQCILMIVNEIIYYLEITLGLDKKDFEYWQEVKQEIEKLQ